MRPEHASTAREEPGARLLGEEGAMGRAAEDKMGELVMEGLSRGRNSALF